MERNTSELDKIIKTHKLTFPEDWATIDIAREILGNDNQDVLINQKINSFREDFEPEPLIDAIPKIRELIKSGYQIAFSMTQFHGDDGGSLYLCYLIKPEHKEEYFRGLDDEITKDENPYFLYNPHYLIQHPDHFIEIWAGAY